MVRGDLPEYGCIHYAVLVESADDVVIAAVDTLSLATANSLIPN